MIFGSVRQVMIMQTAGPTARFDQQMFTTADWAFLATVPAIVGFYRCCSLM